MTSAGARNANRTPMPPRRASISIFAASRPVKRNSRPATLIGAIGSARCRAPRRLAFVASLVHHRHGLIDRQQAAWKTGIQHLRERVLAFARHHVARLADEVLLAFLPP